MTLQLNGCTHTHRPQCSNITDKNPVIFHSQWYKRHSTKKRGELELQVRLDIQQFVQVVDSKMQSVDEVQEIFNKYHSRKRSYLCFLPLSRQKVLKGKKTHRYAFPVQRPIFGPPDLSLPRVPSPAER